MTGERDMSEGNSLLSDSRTPLLKSLPLRSRISVLLSDWWLWEIISTATCILALTLIVVILLLYDSSPFPDWPFVFTVRRHLPIIP